MSTQQTLNPMQWHLDIIDVGNPNFRGVLEVKSLVSFLIEHGDRTDAAGSIPPHTLPQLEPFTKHYSYLDSQQQDGCYRHFFADYASIDRPAIIVQFQPYRGFLDPVYPTTEPTITVGIDGAARLLMQRWDIYPDFVVVDIEAVHTIGTRSRIILNPVEMRSAIRVLTGILNGSQLDRYDDPIWRQPLNDLATERAGISYDEWERFNRS